MGDKCSDGRLMAILVRFLRRISTFLNSGQTIDMHCLAKHSLSNGV
jgi:hypothetical protein